MSADDDQLLQAPDKFSFPFEPYGIQEQFMRTLYDTLEKGGIGIFESPTGTVSSVKIILRDIVGVASDPWAVLETVLVARSVPHTHTHTHTRTP